MLRCILFLTSILGFVGHLVVFICFWGMFFASSLESFEGQHLLVQQESVGFFLKKDLKNKEIDLNQTSEVDFFFCPRLENLILQKPCFFKNKKPFQADILACFRRCTTFVKSLLICGFGLKTKTKTISKRSLASLGCDPPTKDMSCERFTFNLF